jgi:uncharacterized protein (TIGR03435 family)
MGFVALTVWIGSMLFAQARDITGAWQGTLHAEKDLRIVMKVSKADTGGLKATLFNIDQGGRAIPASITVQGATVKVAVVAMGGTYEGKLTNADGTVITGVWTQGGKALPLDLELANEKTAWEIPEPPPPPKLIPANANPKFEVATIKPTQEGTRFSIHPTNSGALVATDATLAYFIKFAYQVHPRQITKGPAWLDTDHYDLTAKPDMEGQPSLPQMRVMLQKLLADRFQLAFHREKKELSAYAITVAKGGLKLTKNETNPNGNPGYGGGPNGMRVVNSTIQEFIGFVLNDSLELPVVDQTGLGSARYDFVLKWTPDTLQSQGGAPERPANADAPPDIFTAMQQQLGLKLEATKTLVDVLVIDKVEKPSEN